MRYRALPRRFALGLAICVLCALWFLPGTATAATYTAGSFAQLVSVVQTMEGGSYADGVLTIPSGATVYITNNINIRGEVTLTGGGTLLRADSCTGYSIPLIWVLESAALTLKDITLDGGAVWTGDSAGENTGTVSGGPVVTVSGQLILQNDAYIQNNDVTPDHTTMGDAVLGGSGVWLGPSATLNMQGGAIRNNRIAGTGAGVYMREYSTFTMTGGAICGNRTLYDAQAPSLYRSNGKGAGVYISSLADACQLSGDAAIHNNTKDTGGGTSDVCISATRALSIPATLTSTLGIETIGLPPAGKPILLATGSGGYTLTQADTDKFLYQGDIGSIVYDAPNACALLTSPLGDVDDSGHVTSFDALLALQISIGSVQPTPAQSAAASVNLGASVTAYDALCILKCAVGSLQIF